jgi:hypothetical protein
MLITSRLAACGHFTSISLLHARKQRIGGKPYIQENTLSFAMQPHEFVVDKMIIKC